MSGRDANQPQSLEQLLEDGNVTAALLLKGDGWTDREREIARQAWEAGLAARKTSAPERDANQLAADVPARTAANLRLIADEMEAGGYNVPVSIATIRRAAGSLDELVALVGTLQRDNDRWLAWAKGDYPDDSPGAVVSAETDGTIVLDDGITTWNPLRALEWFAARLGTLQQERDEVADLSTQEGRQAQNIKSLYHSRNRERERAEAAEAALAACLKMASAEMPPDEVFRAIQRDHGLPETGRPKHPAETALAETRQALTEIERTEDGSKAIEAVADIARRALAATDTESA